MHLRLLYIILINYTRLKHMSADAFFMKKILRFKHCFKFCNITACISHQKPEPHYHKRNIIQQCFFKQRIYQIRKQKWKQARVDIISECMLLQKKMLGCVLCKPETETSKQDKTYYTCGHKQSEKAVVQVIVVVGVVQCTVGILLAVKYNISVWNSDYRR